MRAIFGGFLIAQAVAAAQATAPATFAAHSLQSVFLRPGKAVLPITYRVERVTDGRTFATRIVRAVQGDTQLFVATVGLQKEEQKQGAGGIYQHGEAMPDLGGAVPEDISPNQTEMLLQMGYTQQMIARGPPDPFDWRHLPFSAAEAADASTFRLHSFVRSPPLEADRPAAHLAALAFLTDEWLLGTPSLANPALVAKGSGNVEIQATMTHSILFHDAAAKADEWMVSERATAWADSGRVLVQQRLWNRSTGTLVLSCWQEGLVRLGTTKL